MRQITIMMLPIRTGVLVSVTPFPMFADTCLAANTPVPQFTEHFPSGDAAVDGLSEFVRTVIAEDEFREAINREQAEAEKRQWTDNRGERSQMAGNVGYEPMPELASVFQEQEAALVGEAPKLDGTDFDPPVKS